jgi:hypothetical protein
VFVVLAGGETRGYLVEGPDPALYLVDVPSARTAQAPVHPPDLAPRSRKDPGLCLACIPYRMYTVALASTALGLCDKVQQHEKDPVCLGAR